MKKILLYGLDSEKTKITEKVAKEFDIELNKINNYKFRNPELEILFIAGEDDVVIGGEKGFESSIDILKKVGYKNISSKLYKNMKHEIFREDNREEVFKDLVNFLDK